MKRLWIILLSTTVLVKAVNVQAQTFEAQQLLLDVEKLAQLKNILSDMKKGYEVLSSGYGAIKNISEGNFHLHEVFLNSLLEVSPLVRKYKRVGDIIQLQLKIVSSYRQVLKGIKSTDLFTTDEISYASSVLNSLFKRSLNNLDDLTRILTSGVLRMNDAERLSGIDQIYKEVQEEWSFLIHFNNTTKMLAASRLKDAAAIHQTQNLYAVH